MKRGLIDANGFLALERVNGLFRAGCPFAESGPRGESVNCGTWCVHFGEPEDSAVPKPPAVEEATGTAVRKNEIEWEHRTRIYLSCGKGREFYFEDFKDRRVQEIEREGGL